MSADVDGNQQGPDPARPTVSVVLPIYNVEQWLSACLDSIETQSFTDFEVIVVDDGSPDGSRAIAEARAAHDSRIRVVSQENRGLGGARNRGVREARGEFLTFVDSDDLLPPHALRTLVTAARADRAQIVIGSVQRTDGVDDRPIAWTKQVHQRRRSAITVMDFPELLRNLYTWNKLFERTFWDACNLQFREGVAYEDQPTITLLHAAAQRITVVPEVVYRYRVRPDASSISQQVGSMRDLEDRLSAWSDTRDALLGQGRADIYQAWLAILFSAHFHWYLMNLSRMDETYWSRLRQAVRRFSDDAEPELWRSTAPEHRVLLELVRQGRRDDATDFFARGGRNPDLWPARPDSQGVTLELPFHDDPDLAAALFRVHPDQLEVVHRVERMQWTSQGWQLEGSAHLHRIDTEEHRPQAEVVLRDVDGDEMLVASAQPASPDQASDSFRVVVPVSHLRDVAQPGEEWEVWLRVTAAGFCGEAPITSVARSGSPLAQRAGEVVDDRRLLVQHPRADEPLRLVVERVPIQVFDLQLADRTLSGQLGGPALRTVAGVVLRDESETVRVAPDDSGRFAIEAPVDHASVDLVVERRNGRRLRPVLVDGKYDGAQVGALGDGVVLSGDVQVCRNRRHTLSVEAPSEALVVAAADTNGDAIRVVGQVRGAVDVRACALTLTGPGKAAGGSEAPVRDGEVSLELPTVRETWTGQTLPWQLGSHDLLAIADDGRRLEVRASDDLAGQLPRDFVAGSVEGRLTLGPKGRLRVSVQRPLGTHRSTSGQFRLQARPAGPMRAGVLYRCAAGAAPSSDATALVQEFRAQSDLPQWCGITDWSVPVPAGAHGVIIHSPEWHELVTTARCLVVDVDRPGVHRKPAGQIVVRTGDGTLAADQGPAHRAADRAPGWDVLLAATSGAGAELAADLGHDGEVLALGLPRTDLVVGPGAGELRRAARAAMGLGEDRAVLWSGPGPDSAHVPAGTVLLMLDPAAAEGSGRRRVHDHPDLAALVLAADGAVLSGSGPVDLCVARGLPTVLHQPEPGRHVAPDLLRELEGERARPSEQMRERVGQPDGHASKRVVARLLSDVLGRR